MHSNQILDLICILLYIAFAVYEYEYVPSTKFSTTKFIEWITSYFALPLDENLVRGP